MTATNTCSCGERGKYTGTLRQGMFGTVKALFRCPNGDQWWVRSLRVRQP